MRPFLDAPGVLLDVRSPAEYAHAHVPGAYNFPLFSNEERAIVGTLYKQQGKEAAIEQGLAYVGPKLLTLVQEAKAHLAGKPAKVYCWRGGMRSASVCWLLQTAGIPTSTLDGGYKTYRRWALEQFTIPRNIHILGGYTGSGKTERLNELSETGEQTLDLEAHANHRGSAFGALGMSSQPSQEMFENTLALALSHTNPSHPLWIEDESRMIGCCAIPKTLYIQMQQAPIHWIECPLEERLERLEATFAQAAPYELLNAVKKIEKRLGGVRTQQVISSIQQGDLREAILETLTYYDKTYDWNRERRLSSSAMSR